MSPAWPSTLPYEPNNGKFDETVPGTLIRDQTEIGVAQLRRRGIAEVRELKLPYQLSAEQLDIFDEWFNSNLQGGILAFTMLWPPEPRLQKTVTMRFRSVPTYIHRGGGYHDVDLELEILP